MFRSIFKGLSKLNLPFRRKKFKGQDIDGNMYFEEAVNGSRPRRFVEFADPKKNHHTFYDPNSLPIQWQTWMRFTRNEPPTIEELEQDKQRINEVQEKARILELKDLEEMKTKHASLPHHEAVEAWNPKAMSSKNKG